MKETKESFEMLNNPSHIPIERDEKVCIGCNTCVETCMNDIHVPNPEKGKPPLVFHPDECWYCGSCVMECPLREEGAINLKWPMEIDLQWKRKETGELYRMGMANPPKPNLTPPVGGWVILREAKK